MEDRQRKDLMARLLGIEQDSVSRMERRADMLLSTMSSYVTAMGGIEHRVGSGFLENRESRD